MNDNLESEVSLQRKTSNFTEDFPKQKLKTYFQDVLGLYGQVLVAGGSHG